MLVLVVAATLLGMMRGAAVSDQLTSTAGLVGSTMTVRGVIAEDPQVTARGDTRIVLRDLHDQHRHYPGSLWASVRGEKPYRRADALKRKATPWPA